MKVELKLRREIQLPTAVLGLDAAADGRTLYAACLDGGVYRVDAGGGEPRLLSKHRSYASGVALLEDRSLLVSGGYDGALLVHRLEGGRVAAIDAHRFWSWQIAAASKSGLVASSTGQYLCGGLRYEPLPEREPSVKVFEAEGGECLHALSHVPPVQSVAFSPDGELIAAGNLMGEVRVWEAASGKPVATFTTPSFTGWGIIKGHYYTGGIFSLAFAPDGHLLLAGMGSTTDPAAGNGRQLWERFDFRKTPAVKVDQTHPDESGSGLMETLALHPSNRYFVMAGRLFKGNWNAALFDARTGALLHALDTRTRVTRAVFSADGRSLFLAGAVGQERKNGAFAPFGRIGVYDLAGGAMRRV